MWHSKLILVAWISASSSLASSLRARAPTNIFPNPPFTSTLSQPIRIPAYSSFWPPQQYTRYERGWGACNEQAEGGSADTVFLLEEGASLNNVVIGRNQAEGIYCLGSCTINNVFFEDVCEDAITIKQSGGVSTINGGGAKNAQDKVIQHNGGGRVVINSFYVENFGKLYRSCGNCKPTQHTRHVEINDVWAVNGSYLAGVNSNYGDTATFRNVRASRVNGICQRFNGNNWGGETTAIGSGPDGRHCLYASSDISYV